MCLGEGLLFTAPGANGTELLIFKGRYATDVEQFFIFQFRTLVSKEIYFRLILYFKIWSVEQIYQCSGICYIMWYIYTQSTALCRCLNVPWFVLKNCCSVTVAMGYIISTLFFVYLILQQRNTRLDLECGCSRRPIFSCHSQENRLRYLERSFDI